MLEFWAMGAEGENVGPLIERFEAENPGVRVEVQRLPWTSAHEKLLTSFAGRATPDVSQLGNTWVAEMEALGALRALDESVRQSEVVDEADYFRGTWDTNVIDGRLWGVPWYVDTRLLFYRTDLLAEAGYDAPPETWAEWTEAMRAVQRVQPEGGYPILLPVNEFEPPLILALNTADLLRDGERFGNFRSDGFRRAFEFYIGLYRDGLAPATSGTEISNLYQEFARGQFASYITGPWNIGEFQRRLPDSLDGRWATAPIPGPDAGTPGVSVAGGSSLVVFEGTEHPEAAWALVEFLSRPEVQVEFNGLTGNLPPREAAWERSGLADDEYARAFRDQLRHVRPTPKVPEQERIAQTIRVYGEFAARGEMTVDEAVAAIDRDVDRILEKRRWLLEREETGSVGAWECGSVGVRGVGSSSLGGLGALSGGRSGRRSGVARESSMCSPVATSTTPIPPYSHTQEGTIPTPTHSHPL
ncbi:MAG: sugar ABC transporter substrate-binding protein [Bacteroidota bacterium]